MAKAPRKSSQLTLQEHALLLLLLSLLVIGSIVRYQRYGPKESSPPPSSQKPTLSKPELNRTDAED